MARIYGGNIPVVQQVTERDRFGMGASVSLPVYTGAYGLYETSGNRSVTLGSGPDLVDTNTVLYTAGKHSSNAALFDHANDETLVVTDATIDSLYSPNAGHFAVSFWLNWTGGDSNFAWCFFIGDHTYASAHAVLIRFLNGAAGDGIQALVYADDGSTSTYYTGNSSFTAASFPHHIVVQLNRTTHKVELYVDSVEQGVDVSIAAGDTFNWLGVGAARMVLMANKDVSTSFNSGWMQDLIINNENTLWTQSDINSLYNSGNGILIS